MTYLDTHVVVGLYQADLAALTPAALKILDSDDDLRISPMVLLELEYLYEIKRIKMNARRILDALALDIGLKLCDAPFAEVARKALEERWTRDPFDRIILAHARSRRANLITRDRELQARYAQAFG